MDTYDKMCEALESTAAIPFLIKFGFFCRY